MHIRRLRHVDAPALLPLCEQLGYPSTLNQMEARLQRLLGSTADACFGAEQEDGHLIGWIHVQGRHLLELDPFAEICALVVDELTRGNGTGRALLEAAEAWAHENRYPELRVRSNIRRERAHHFYQQLGYSLTKTSHLFVKLPVLER